MAEVGGVDPCISSPTAAARSCRPSCSRACRAIAQVPAPAPGQCSDRRSCPIFLGARRNGVKRRLDHEDDGPRRNAYRAAVPPHGDRRFALRDTTIMPQSPCGRVNAAPPLGVTSLYRTLVSDCASHEPANAPGDRHEQGDRKIWRASRGCSAADAGHRNSPPAASAMSNAPASRWGAAKTKPAALRARSGRSGSARGRSA
jgi:hypothetical protein